MKRFPRPPLQPYWSHLKRSGYAGLPSMGCLDKVPRWDSSKDTYLAALQHNSRPDHLQPELSQNPSKRKLTHSISSTWCFLNVPLSHHHLISVQHHEAQALLSPSSIPTALRSACHWVSARWNVSLLFLHVSKMSTWSVFFSHSPLFPPSVFF